MGALDEELRAEMRAKQAQVKERMNSGTFTSQWALGGKNAVVASGASVIVRLMPHWAFGAEAMVAGADGKRVKNPAYKVRRSYVSAFEHWWETADKKYQREWCPKTLDPAADCPICKAVVAMSASSSDEDKKFAKRVQAKEIFIYNAVVGSPRKVGADGKADIRIISCGGTVYNGIVDVMAGPEDAPQFGRGNIMDPRDGFDLVFNRPAAKSAGERWTVGCAPQPSPLYEPDQRAAFAGWAERMLDLDKMLKDEMKSASALFKSFMGRDPKPGEVEGVVSAPPPQTTSGRAPINPSEEEDDDLGPGRGVTQDDDQQGESEPDSPDDVFLPPPAAASRERKAPPVSVPSGLARAPRR